MMKKLLTAISMVFCVLSMTAQSYHKVPNDDSVRVGKLPNGLTYYIRQHKWPEHQADFYIAQKVGSILEEENQRGLAHFLEHMAFNGSEHFKGNSLQTYLQSKGVKYGGDLNAYTSIDQTVYNICNAPVNKAGVTDSCLLILKDWSNAISLESKEIDKERGVIHEEWRSRRDAYSRMDDSIYPKIFPGQRYGDRLPIGLMSVVDSFPYKMLRDYYKKWYRPDLQAIIVVGDINPDEIEAKMKKLFAKNKVPKHAAERVYYPIEGNKEPLVAIGSDKECTDVTIQIYIKHDAPQREYLGSTEAWMASSQKNLFSYMMSQRLNDITRKKDCPMKGGSVDWGNSFIITNAKSQFSYSMSANPDKWREALKILIREVERAHRYGFTQTEMDRVLNDWKVSNENSYQNRNKISNTQYVNDYVNNFLLGYAMASPKTQYEISKEQYNQLKLSDVNSVYKSLDVDSNMVVIMYMPKNDSLKIATPEEVLNIIHQARKDTISPYVDRTNNGALVPVLPRPGKVISRKPGFNGSTELILSNGVRMIIKPTTFDKDAITLSGYKMGGTSLLDTRDKREYRFLNRVTDWGGLGDFSSNDLQKKLAGKLANVSIGFGGTEENIYGSCSKKDFHTMMELTYLNFTAPRKDVEQFEAFKEKAKKEIINSKIDPYYGFSDSVSHAVLANTGRQFFVNENNLDSINYDRMLELYRQRTADVNGMTLCLVGSFDTDSVIPDIEQYIGSLPSTGIPETFKYYPEYSARKADFRNVYHKDMNTPAALSYLIYTMEKGYKYNPENHFVQEALCSVLDQVLDIAIREQEGATYGVSVRSNEDHYPVDQITYYIAFKSSPENRARMVRKIKDELQKIATENVVTEKLLANYKEGIVRDYPRWKKENHYNTKVLFDYYYNGFYMDEKMAEMVKAIKPNDVKEFAKRLLDNSYKYEIGITSGNTDE